MGLIKAIAGAAGGVMADQWKEFFTCEALPAGTEETPPPFEQHARR